MWPLKMAATGCPETSRCPSTQKSADVTNIVAEGWNNAKTQQAVRNSSVGIATRYGLNGPLIESRWRPDFPHWSRPGLGPTQSPIPRGGVKRTGRGVNHPRISSAKVKERVELYVYSPSGPSWPVLGWTLPLPLPLPYIIGNTATSWVPRTHVNL